MSGVESKFLINWELRDSGIKELVRSTLKFESFGRRSKCAQIGTLKYVTCRALPMLDLIRHDEQDEIAFFVCRKLKIHFCSSLF